MPVKATKTPAIVPAPKFTWTGCYVGGHIGGGWTRTDFSNPAGFNVVAFGGLPRPVFGQPDSFNDPQSGLLGGGQAGCKLELVPNWIVGIEGDFSRTHLVSRVERSLANPTVVLSPIPTSFSANTHWLASAVGNLGYSFDGLLVYVKGGFAWDRDDYGFSGVFGGFFGFDFDGNDRRTGWTAGAGLEYPFWKNFTAKFEYDYYDFGNRNVQFADQLASGFSAGSADIRQQIHAVKFGLNYYFWNAPASATAAAAPARLVTKAPVAARGPASLLTWTDTFSTETRYFSWQSNRGSPTSVPVTGGGSGAELYIPYASKLVGQAEDFKVELLGRGGWVWARQSTAGLTGAVTTDTDTVGSATFTYLGINGVQPFAAINFNLPTGQAALFGPSANARMDPDLVDIASFGEGFNVGPTVGFNVALTPSFIITPSVGYTHRGNYLREDTLAPIPGAPPPTVQTPTEITPGDALTVATSAGWQNGPLTSKLTGTISETQATVENGIQQFRAGTRYLGSGTWSYAWPDVYGVTTLTASAAHSNRNEVLFLGPPILVKEIANTNSNLYRIGLEHLFPIERLTIGPTGSFLFRDHNGYDAATLQFVPAKTRWAAGVLARFAASDNFVLNARVEHVWTHEDENPAPGGTKLDALSGALVPLSSVPVVSSTGWQVTGGATGKF